MQVTIYTTPACNFCKMAKKFFEAHGVAYRELDVSENRGAFEEMVRKSHQAGVPVIEIAGEIFVGFDRALIARATGIGKQSER